MPANGQHQHQHMEGVQTANDQVQANQVDANGNPINAQTAQGELNGNPTGEEEDELKDEEAANEPDINCDEFRVPPSILVARRAASEAYWAFDKALSVAERKVGEALDAAIVRGA